MHALSITARPKHWDEIVGQDRALGVIKGILRNGKFPPRGVVLEGPTGVGKTTTAYVLAKALMCTGGDPLGCGACPSCLTFQENPDSHPDFREVDAASYSGVERARQLVEEAMELPTLGKVRVLLIDEAHRQSREALDIYLKPLEQIHARYAFLFATTDAKRIPDTLRGRCVPLRFSRVPTEILSGFLAAVASRGKMDYEMGGIKLVARTAKGHVRDALELLDKVSSLGRVTRDLVEYATDVNYTDMAINALVHLAAGSLKDACSLLDDMARIQQPHKVIQDVFSAYGRAVFGDNDTYPEELRRYVAVKTNFPDHSKVTEVLLKWSSTERIPADALPLFAQELYGLRATTLDTPQDHRTPRSTAPMPTAAPTTMSSADLLKSLDAVKLDG